MCTKLFNTDTRQCFSRLEAVKLRRTVYSNCSLYDESIVHLEYNINKYRIVLGECKQTPTYLCTLLQNECESPLVDHTYPNMDAAYKPSINHGYLLQHKNLAYTVASAPDRHGFNNQRFRLFSGQREWQMASYYFVLCLFTIVSRFCVTRFSKSFFSIYKKGHGS